MIARARRYATGHDENPFTKEPAHQELDSISLKSWGGYQFGDLVNASVMLHIDPQAEYKPPAVWINDEELEGLAFEFKDTGAPTCYLRAFEHIDGCELQRDKEWPFKIDVNWRMTVWPQWVLGAPLADNRLVVRLQTQRKFMTEATITCGGALEKIPAADESFKSFASDATLCVDAVNSEAIGVDQ